MPSCKPKLLIADGSQELVKMLLSCPEAASYQIETACDGLSCLEKFASFQPGLVIVDQKLPRMHGIEILRRVKEQSKAGVIITAFQAMQMNYHWAIDFGVDYFLEKPFKPAALFALIARYFAGTLKPDPFQGLGSSMQPCASCYAPKAPEKSTYLKFWGTRGSCSVSGKDYIRYGGNTPCLEVRNGDDLVIIDAGSGLRPLGDQLKGARWKDYHIFISHTHWDHLAGFTFFAPLFEKKNTIHIWTPVGFRRTTEELFSRMFTYPFFPARFDDIGAKMVFHDLRDGDVNTVGSIEVSAAYAYHPGPTLCFKLRFGGQTIGYVTDNELLMGYHGDPKEIGSTHPLLDAHRAFIDVFKNADVMVHEAQYTPLEYQNKVGWGHSSITNAAAVLRHIDPKRWVVTHHDPSHGDEEMRKILQMHLDLADHLQSPGQVVLAFDNFVIPL